MKEQLLKSPKPLYKEMMATITIDEDVDLVPFCLQWGKDFPSEKDTGILFVGRATNGWVTTSKQFLKFSTGYLGSDPFKR